MSSPDWVKTRLDLRPQSQGFAFLDQASLAPYIAATTAAAIPQDGVWQTSLTFATNIASYNNSLRYRKNSHGQVEIEGRWLYNGAGTAASGNLFQLPVGYRPLSDSGLNVERAVPSFIELGDRDAAYWGAGLTNVYAIESPLLWLQIKEDGWVAFTTNVWGQLRRVGANNDGAFDMDGQWKNWGNAPWSNLFGRIYNFRFPTD